MKLAFISLLLFLMPAHKFYVSVTEIRYNDKAKTIEIASKIFIDDLESAVEDLRITDEEDSKTNELVGAYLMENSSVVINDEEVTLNYLGYEIEDDVIWCYIEGSDVELPSKVTLAFDMLLDEIEKQTNIVHFELDKDIKTVFLVGEKREETLMFP